MKKNLFMVAAVALMAMVSCNKEEIGNNGVEGGQASDIVFSAELEQPDGGAAVAPAAAQTKTSLGEAVNNIRPVTWNAGDKIKVNGVTFSAKEAGPRTDFETTESFSAAETYYAVYPASAAGAADHSMVTIPASQTGTFAEAAISVAQSNTQSLHFKNIASILKFQVPAACSEVTIESTSDLAGTFPVTFDDKGLPVIGTVTNGSKKITLTGSFVTGTDYYAAVLPDSHTFTIRLDGYLSKASTTAVTTKRAVSSNLKTLPAPVASVKYGVAGTMQTPMAWDAAKPIVMYEDTNDRLVIRNIELYKDDEFKVVVDKSWNTSYGDGTDNMKVSKNGVFDIEFNTSTKKITATCTKENTNVKVQVTVNVNRPWTAVYLHLWEEKGSSDTPINQWPGVKLGSSSGKYTYELDGKYIGTEIGYILNNNMGDQTSDLSLPLSSRQENVMTASAYDVYLKPNSNWTQSNAWFAIYCWKSDGNAWAKMSKVNSNIYGAYLPEGYSKGCSMKFVRMNSADTNTLSWDNKWDESSNLTCPTTATNCYSPLGWNNGGGSWGSPQ